MGRRREKNAADVTTAFKQFGPVRIVVATNRGRVLVKGDKSLVGDETRDQATRWVINTLREHGWAVPDPLSIRDSLWAGPNPTLER